MRIVISSPPKSGNNWLMCLLGSIYDLEALDETPATRPETIREWAENGRIPDHTIFYQHCRFSQAMADAIEAIPAHNVSIVRDPYDVFVSLYYWVQNRAAYDKVERKPRPRDVLIGKPLDHPDVLAYLADEFGTNLMRANGWLHSQRSVVVRYEELHRDPIGELRRATNLIAAVPMERIAHAIEACTADNMRQTKDHMVWHVRAAKVGDSKERLVDQHLAVFRKHHADLIRSLGYEVR